MSTVFKTELNLPFLCHYVDKEYILNALHGEVMTLSYKMTLSLCISGKASFMIDCTPYEINRSDLFFLPPSHFAKIKDFTDDFRALILQIDYDHMMSIVYKTMDISNALRYLEKPYMTLSEDQYKELYYKMTELMQRVEHEEKVPKSKNHRLILRELLLAMTNVIIYQTIHYYVQQQENIMISEKTEIKNRDELIVQNFIISIHNHFKKTRDVSSYAQMQCLTPGYLSYIIKEKTGRTALQWIIEAVVSYAKQMLRHTDMSIKEISTLLHFPTQSAFSKYFKLYVGTSPKQYRSDNT